MTTITRSKREILVLLRIPIWQPPPLELANYKLHKLSPFSFPSPATAAASNLVLLTQVGKESKTAKKKGPDSLLLSASLVAYSSSPPSHTSSPGATAFLFFHSFPHSATFLLLLLPLSEEKLKTFFRRCFFTATKNGGYGSNWGVLIKNIQFGRYMYLLSRC